jgi:hypothetical protein
MAGESIKRFSQARCALIPRSNQNSGELSPNRSVFLAVNAGRTAEVRRDNFDPGSGRLLVRVTSEESSAHKGDEKQAGGNYEQRAMP